MDLPGQATYVYRWRRDLMAATDQGRLYRVAPAGDVEDMTAVGRSAAGRRPVFLVDRGTKLVIAAGGPIVRLRKGQDEPAIAAGA